MRNVIKIILVWGLILTCIIGSWGCKGGKIPELGDISGPATVDEYGYVEYSVSFVNATGATFLWSCDPSDAGQLDKADSQKTGFTASMVTHDTPVKISVMVNSLQSSPVILSKNITVRDVTKLSVGEIEGPDNVDEGSPVTYSVAATDDTGITYQWSSIPDDLGIFDTPDQPLTQFTAHYLDENTPLEIQVNIESDNYDPVLMKKIVTIMDKGPYGWARTWGGSSPDNSYGVAVDGSGNAYVTGCFEDTVDFDPGIGVVRYKSNRWNDIFLSKFDSNGEFQWARTWGGLYADKGYGVAVDGSGNAYVTGFFAGTVDFDPGPGEDKQISNGSYDIFLSKFDTNGDFQWTRTWGGNNDHFFDVEYGYEVAVDGSGNAYVTGIFYDTADFDPGPGVDEHKSNGVHDIFLSKFDSSGDFQWARTCGGLSRNNSYGVAIDACGNVYLTGNFQNIVDFDPGPEVVEYKSNGLDDIFLSKFDSNGEFQWARTWGGDDRDHGGGVAVDGSGNAYVTGYFRGTVDFNPGPEVEEHSSNGYVDVFLSKFDSSGEFQWTRTWGGSDYDFGFGIAVDGSGNAYVTGYFRGTVDFNPGPGEDKQISNGSYDIFLSKFDSIGNFQWANTWGGNGEYDYGCEVTVDGCGYAYVTGYFMDIVDFDPGPGVDEYRSNGYADIFLSKFLQDGTW